MLVLSPTFPCTPLQLRPRRTLPALTRCSKRCDLPWCSDAVRLLGARVLDAIRGAALRWDAEALEAEQRSSAVAEASPLTVLRGDGHAGVNVEAAR